MTLSEVAPGVGEVEPESAAAFLLRDRAWGAYPLGYLDPASMVKTHAWSGVREGGRESLLVIAQLPQLLSVFATGDPLGVEAILASLPAIPASGVFSARAECLEAMERYLHVSTASSMRRMRVDRQAFRPRARADAVRLDIAHLEQVQRLYGMWTDAHQLPSQLSLGVYYGIYGEGGLIAIAGTHCHSAKHGVGAVGNVLTHSFHRGRGLAGATTTAVTEELFRMGCEEVVLNVRNGNDAAMAAYTRLGFTQHCTFVEGIFHARGGRRPVP